MRIDEFLLARIVDDEEAAVDLHATGCYSSWWEHDHLGYSADECDCRWPQWVLAECAAKRTVVEECQAWLATFERTDVWGGWPDITSKQHAETVLELLARPYADHPDFDPAWADTPPQS